MTAVASESFSCLRCGRIGLRAGAERFRCEACGAIYPVRGGIPLLVRDPEAHEADLQAAREAKPGWYEEPQPPESESPYRFRLEARRRFWQHAIGAHLADTERTKAARVLDLGCGDGNNLPGLAPFAEDLFASDYNLVRLVRAKTLHPEVPVFLANILDYPVPEAFFDVVFCNHVLEHIPDDRAALATIFRILAPSGLLVLGVPNEGAWWWRLAYRLDRKQEADTDHVHFYTAPAIRARLRDAGFEVMTTRGMGWGVPHWGWDLRLVRRRGWYRLFEALGPLLLPGQAASLYALARKPGAPAP